MVAFLLPHERKFVRSEGLLASGKQMLAHLRNRQLIATYAVGFGVLFNFICTFTYVSFYLAAPPYNLSASWLGAIFVVYLTGSVLTPWTGWAVGRFGRRRFMVRVIAVWVAGIALTLVAFAAADHCGTRDLRRLRPDLSGGFDRLCHRHRQGRALVGGRALCHLAFMSAAVSARRLGGLAWTFGGWPACVALVAAMLAIMSAIVYFRLGAPRAGSTSMPPIEPP